VPFRLVKQKALLAQGFSSDEEGQQLLLLLG
jgi:hypothetical protein